MSHLQLGLVEHVAWTAHAPLDAPGTPVLLLHGVTDSGTCWPAAVDHLVSPEAPARPVLTLDARGHGRSGLPDEPFTVAALAAEAAAVLREVVGRPALVVGHSMGGLTAEELAITEPALVAGLLLEDPAWVRGHDDGRGRAENGAPDWLRGVIAEAAVSTQEELEARSRQENPHWPEDEHRTGAASARQVNPRLADLPHVWDGRDWVEALAQVEVPVTLLTGDPERGAIVDAAQVARAAELLGTAPSGRLTHVPVPGTGHCIRRDDRAAHLRALDDAVALADRT